MPALPVASAGAVSTALRREDHFPKGWERWFFKAVDADSRIVALLGCQPAGDLAQGWLWGPWSSPDHSARGCLTPLLEMAIRSLPKPLRQLDAFLHVENRVGLNALQGAGFALRTITHIYSAQPPPGEGSPELGVGVRPAQDRPSKESLAYLRAAHEIAFVNLHASSFPTASEMGQLLLDGRDDEHIILAAADGLRLLGYVCISVNYTPHEGFIDYIAVRPSARGRGVGRWLLDQAKQWIFHERRLPQAALCVTDWREDARRLYEHAGFRLNATGRGARRHLDLRRKEVPPEST